MDSSSELKHRAEKLYKGKAESQWESLSQLSSVPKIDPLSRRVAEVVTQKELSILGIKPVETPLKKALYSISHLESPQKSALKPSLCQPSQDQVKRLTPDRKSEYKVAVSSLPSQIEPEISNPDILQNAGPPEPRKNNPEIREKTDENRENHENPEKTGENPVKHVEVLNNLEHIQAFKEELHRDYPELGLNNSVEGSSFHTNELHELEEACKDLNTDKSDGRNPHCGHQANTNKHLIGSKGVVNEERLEIEKFSNMTEHGSTKLFDANQGKGQGMKQDIDVQESSGFKNGNLDSVIQKNRSEGRMGHSKSFGMKSESLDFGNLQNSYMKASFLHSVQDSIPKAVPRCHLNLGTNEVSPIYFNVRVAKDSRVKNPNGIGPADCLRKLLLKDEGEVVMTDRPDIYSRSAIWLEKRDEKAKRSRESRLSSDMQNCTFDPFIGKKKKHSKSNSEAFINFSVNLSKSKISYSQKTEDEKPKNTLKYVGLSPADSLVRYAKGVDREKFRDKAKPMVSYRQINLLK